MTDTDEKIAELKEVTRLANEALGDLKRERRAAEKYVQVALKDVKDMLEAEVRKQVELLSESTRKAMAASVEKVQGEFDKLADVFLGRDDPTKPSLQAMAEEANRHAELLRRRHARRIADGTTHE